MHEFIIAYYCFAANIGDCCFAADIGDYCFAANIGDCSFAAKIVEQCCCSYLLNYLNQKLSPTSCMIIAGYPRLRTDIASNLAITIIAGDHR